MAVIQLSDLFYGLKHSETTSRYALWRPVLNQMIRDMRFEVPFWIKWFAIRALKAR